MKTSGLELDCLKYIDKCIECLDTSLTVTKSTKAIESIKLQKDHHKRQRDLVQFHVDKFKKSDKQSPAEVHSEEKIFQAYKGHNDLFENLKMTEETLDELKSANPECSIRLFELNTQLQRIINNLVNQVDEAVVENEHLRCRISEFENRGGSNVVEHRISTLNDDLLDIAENHEEFAPLDLPKFDVS